MRNDAFVVIVGEKPINVSLNNIVAVIPSWGPIYEFTFDMRINKMPSWNVNPIRGIGDGGHPYCYQVNSRFDGVGMVMRLGADGSSSTSRTSQSMAPIVFLGLNNLFICIHNIANPNEVKNSNMSWFSRAGPTDVCGDMCNLSQEASIGISSSVFLAAKRSSTPALVPESVRLWSKLNFSLFSQLMTTYDNL